MDGHDAPGAGFSAADVGAVIQRFRRGLIVLDADDRVDAVNAICAAALRSTPAELVGRSIWEAVPGLADTPVGEAVREARASGAPVSTDGYIPQYRRWIETDITPRDDRLVVVIEDLTSMMRLRLTRLLHERLDGIPQGASFDDDLHALVGTVRRTIEYVVGEAWVVSRHGDGAMRLRACDHDDDPVWATFAARSRTIVLPGEPVEPEEVDAQGVVRVPDLRHHDEFLDLHGTDGQALRALFRIPVDVGAGVRVNLSFLSVRPLDADPWCDILATEADVLRTWLRGRWAQHELRRFMEVSQELLWTVDADMVLRQVNPRLLTAFGYEESDVVGHDFTEFIADDRIDWYRAQFPAFVDRGDELDEFELPLRDAHGATRLTTWRARADPHERVVYAAGRDVTEERRAARRRELRNDVLVSVAAAASLDTTLGLLARSLEEQQPDVLASIVTYDAERRTVHVAAAPSLDPTFLAAIEGAEVGPLAGSCGTAIHERRPVTASDIATDPRWAPWRDVAIEHGLRACWSVPVLDSAGEPLGSFAMYRSEPSEPDEHDLDALNDAVQLASIAIERAKTERRLADSEQRLRLLADVMTDAMFDWDLTTGAIWYSESRSVFAELSGEHPPEALLKREHVHPDDLDLTVRTVEDAIRAGAPDFEVDYRFRRPDGTYADVTATGTIVRNADGRAVRVVGGLTDVTEQRQLERQHLRGQRMESIGNLASGIAHDLNNTLAPIVMAVDVLRSRPLDDDVRATVELIDTSVRRGADMVRQVLNFARGQDGDRIEIEPSRLVRDLERFVRDSFPKSVAIRTHVEPDLPPVSGDPTQLHQVLLNLAVNARDAMPDGGELVVTAGHEHVERGGTRERGLPPGDYVVLRVRDTGTGIGATDIERIFEPFFSTKPATLGTGLGLSTSLAIVQRHGGTITVDSRAGEGAEFTVHLPVVTRRRGATNRPHPVGAARGEGEYVLVVDDEEPLREITARVLTDNGYVVATAPNGAEALAVIDRLGTVDVVVTDLAMPVMDGTSLVRELRARGLDIPVIVVSGLIDGTDTGDLLRHGVTSVLPKPFAADALLHQLRHALAAG